MLCIWNPNSWLHLTIAELAVDLVGVFVLRNMSLQTLPLHMIKRSHVGAFVWLGVPRWARRRRWVHHALSCAVDS